MTTDSTKTGGLVIFNIDNTRDKNSVYSVTTDTHDRARTFTTPQGTTDLEITACNGKNAERATGGFLYGAFNKEPDITSEARKEANSIANILAKPVTDPTLIMLKRINADLQDGRLSEIAKDPNIKIEHTDLGTTISWQVPSDSPNLLETKCNKR